MASIRHPTSPRFSKGESSAFCLGMGQLAVVTWRPETTLFYDAVTIRNVSMKP